MNLSSQTVALIRAGIAVVAALFAAGVIPTAVDGGGAKVSAALIAMAFAIPAGERNPPAPTVVTTPEGQVAAIITPPPAA